MTKVGKSAKDIFATTTRQADAPGKATGPGRPAVHAEPWTKATVVLFDRQIAFLDRLSVDIKLKTGSAIHRAELIRAMIDAVAEAGIDLTDAGSEADLKAVLTAKLTR